MFFFLLQNSMEYHDPSFFVPGNLWGYLILLYVYVQASRIIVVGVSYPFLWYFGYGLDWKEAIILIWSGLRGAVALSLSLSFQASFDELDYSYSEIMMISFIKILLYNF